MLPMKLELKATHILVAIGVVADDLHSCGFADVILVAIKNDLRDAFRRTKSDETSDLVLQRESQVTRREDQSWSKNVDHGAASKR